jgi:hypothetical protein
MPVLRTRIVRVSEAIPSSRHRLEQAMRLGYLKCDLPLGRLASSWRDYCEEHQIPFVAMVRRGPFWEIVYSVPADDPFVLRPSVMAELHRRIDAARDPASRSLVFATERQGEITGLSPDRAEPIAFYLSEVLNDPACLQNSEREV